MCGLTVEEQYGCAPQQETPTARIYAGGAWQRPGYVRARRERYTSICAMSDEERERPRRATNRETQLLNPKIAMLHIPKFVYVMVYGLPGGQDWRATGKES